MCWQCDHPGSTWLDYLEHVRDVIACHGWAMQGVQRDRIRPPWAYTVGLTSRDRPELVVTGMPMARASELLHDVASHVLHADAPRPGEQIPLCGGPVIEIVEVDAPDVHLATAVGLYGPGIRALQLVHADDRGHWPWDVGFRGMRGGQPILGVRAERV
jgi:transposase